MPRPSASVQNVFILVPSYGANSVQIFSINFAATGKANYSSCESFRGEKYGILVACLVIFLSLEP